MPWIHRLAAALAAAAPALTWAEVATDATLWRCWQAADQHLTCVLAQAASPAATPARSLPVTLSNIRQRPAGLAGQLVRIPLHTEPFDTTWVAELAQAVMCGSQPSCRARLDTQPASSLASAAALADAHDPLLATAD